MPQETWKFITSDDTEVEIVQVPGSLPGMVFLGGLGARGLFEKGQFLLEKCKEEGRAFTFINWQTPKNGTVSEWRSHLREAFQAASGTNPQIVIASSFGAWLADLLAKDLEASGQKNPLTGMIFINPVFDGTRIAASGIRAEGRSYLAAGPEHVIPFQLPSMSEPFMLRQQHLDDGEKNLIMSDTAPAARVQTVIFHAAEDEASPLALSEAYVQKASGFVRLVTVPGQHNLNTPEFLERLWSQARAMGRPDSSSPSSSPGGQRPRTTPKGVQPA